MIKTEICFICSNKSFTPFLSCEDYTVSHETFNLVTCTSCGLILTSPRPKAEHLGKYYVSTDYISHSNKATTLIDSLYLIARSYTLRWKLNLINKKIQFKGQPSLLDYGCGTGNFLVAAQQKKWGVAGVEPSVNARENAEPTVRPLIHNSIESIAQSDFDAITLWHVLEHLPEPIQTLQALTKKLKNNGMLFIAVPNPKSWDACFYKHHWAGYDVPRHLWHFSQSNITNIAKKLSLELTDTVPMKLDAFYVSLLSEKYKNKNQKLSNLISGFTRGFKSNLKASKSSEYSSLIYILKKHE